MVDRGYRLTAIDHVQLAMPPGADAEAEAERFYYGLLGLERLAEARTRLAARGGCWFSNDAVVLHLGVEDDFRAARKAHPALVVDSLEASPRRSSRRTSRCGPTTSCPASAARYVDDPFGNRIELVEGG